MRKMLVFDMDGTIANLYGVSDWLTDLEAESVRPYAIAEPMYNMNELASLLCDFKKKGWRIAVTTWLAKDSSHKYKKAVSITKKEWLLKYNFPYDEIHCIQYGRTKADSTRKKADYQILIDDNEKVRAGWSLGSTINANKDIITELKKVLAKEV